MGTKGESMDSQFYRLQRGCIFLLLFFIASCSLQAVKKPEGEKEFFQEASRLEKRAREHPETSVRGQSHLQLAFLYVNYRNPNLNYTRALQEMESYFSLAPGKVQTDDVQNWLAVLKEVGKLQTGMERMQKVNKSLRDEVAGLKETIERLKSLDRHIEQRRSLTK
jgi:outer membrane protein assembly factor BamD (BamD/ComL family)